MNCNIGIPLWDIRYWPVEPPPQACSRPRMSPHFRITIIQSCVSFPKPSGWLRFFPSRMVIIVCLFLFAKQNRSTNSVNFSLRYPLFSWDSDFSHKILHFLSACWSPYKDCTSHLCSAFLIRAVFLTCILLFSWNLYFSLVFCFFMRPAPLTRSLCSS